MKRYPAYEFPEYVDWTPDPEVQARFTETIARDPDRAALIAALDEDALLDLYRGLVAARLHDVQLKRWVKQGVITKAWLASGEEAVTVGACAALGPDDVVGPMIRNAAALIERGVPLVSCFAGYLGTTDTITRGRDLHIGDLDKGVVPPISHIGDLVPVMAGAAMAFRMRGEKRVALTWTGDGSTATGAFHEGLRTAAAFGAPLVCVVQDNQVALGTPVEAAYRGDFTAFGQAYGTMLIEMDGNHVLDCYAATRRAIEACRAGDGPVIIVTRTFRMGGHATHDEREARELFDDAVYRHWGQRDPVGCYETWLVEERGIDRARLEAIEARVSAEIDAAAEEAKAGRGVREPDPATVSDGVYAPIGAG